MWRKQDLFAGGRRSRIYRENQSFCRCRRANRLPTRRCWQRRDPRRGRAPDRLGAAGLGDRRLIRHPASDQTSARNAWKHAAPASANAGAVVCAEPPWRVPRAACDQAGSKRFRRARRSTTAAGSFRLGRKDTARGAAGNGTAKARGRHRRTINRRCEEAASPQVRIGYVPIVTPGGDAAKFPHSDRQMSRRRSALRCPRRAHGWRALLDLARRKR